MTKPIIGILGAGKLGMTLAKLGVDAGYQVNISGSNDPQKIKLSVDVLATGAVPHWTKDLIKESDVIFFAMPLSKYQQIPAALLKDKLIIDSMNFWWEIDGKENDYYDDSQTSSEAVQKYFAPTTVIKAFNHMGYHDLASMPNQNRVIVYAGDNEVALEKVKQIIQDFGFVPYYLGSLKQTKVLQPSGVLFGVNEDLNGIKRILK